MPDQITKSLFYPRVARNISPVRSHVCAEYLSFQHSPVIIVPLANLMVPFYPVLNHFNYFIKSGSHLVHTMIPHPMSLRRNAPFKVSHVSYCSVHFNLCWSQMILWRVIHVNLRRDIILKGKELIHIFTQFCDITQTDGQIVRLIYSQDSSFTLWSIGSVLSINNFISTPSICPEW